MSPARLDLADLIVHDVQAGNPDGNGVGIMSPIVPAMRSEPPAPA